MAAWKTAGDWLGGSGWSEVLIQAKIASPGVVESFLKAAHLKRTRLAHIVTVAALNVTRHRAYEGYTARLLPSNEILLE